MMKRPRSRSGRVRLAALLILCLFALPLAAVACGKAPAGGAATAVPAAARETAPPAQETATPEPTESERIAAGGTQMRLNAFFWDAGFPWGAFHHNTQEFVIFTPENAVYGHSDTIDEARSYLETGVVTGTVEIGKTLTYTVTQAYYIPVRDLEGEYLASAVICMHDPAGEILDFTYTLDFYHQLISSDFHDSIDCVEMQYFYHDILDFVFEPAQAEPTLPYTVPDPYLWDCWVDESQWDDFMSQTAHTQNDIPYLFFRADKVFLGSCASVDGLASVVCNYEGYNKQANVNAWYDFTVANPTFGWCGTIPNSYPYFDTADITVTLADSTTQEIHITQGSIIEWNGVRYRWTQRLEEEHIQ